MIIQPIRHWLLIDAIQLRSRFYVIDYPLFNISVNARCCCHCVDRAFKMNTTRKQSPWTQLMCTEKMNKITHLVTHLVWPHQPEN